MSTNGIDVSTFQGNIDWPSVQNDGIDFAMLRASYGTSTDNQFVNNIKNISQTSLGVGAYHFFYATTNDEALEEARYFLDVISPYKFSYPVALDLEYEPLLKLGSETLTNIIITFCDTLEKAGYYMILYANLNWLVNYLNMDILDRYDVWLAQWGPEPTYSGNFGMWQYTSSGSVNGINGNVDRDIAYRDYPTIIRSKGLNGYASGGDTPDPTPTPPAEGDYYNYTVVSGDTLWGIARRFLGNGSLYPEIASLNGITGDVIYPGQVIKIPRNSDGTINYTVVSGDTLWSISRKFLGSGTLYPQIISLNGLSSDVIFPGQILKIPV